MAEHLLEIKDLTSAFLFGGKPVPVIFDVSYTMEYGEILGIVGESGSGKSVTAKNVMRLLPSPPSSVLGGEIILDGESILDKTEKQMRQIRGNKVSMIFQEPMTSLNPVFTCGDQIVEAIVLHQKVSKAEAKRRAIEMLDLVGIAQPEKRMDSYPHELSGGMLQRVCIAAAIVSRPRLLLADEPTTALDVTIQAQILELLKRLNRERNMSILFISHNLNVVRKLCTRVAVMERGLIVEEGETQQVFHHPEAPYTQRLIAAIPTRRKIDG